MPERTRSKGTLAELGFKWSEEVLEPKGPHGVTALIQKIRDDFRGRGTDNYVLGKLAFLLSIPGFQDLFLLKMPIARIPYLSVKWSCPDVPFFPSKTRRPQWLEVARPHRLFTRSLELFLAHMDKWKAGLRPLNQGSRASPGG